MFNMRFTVWCLSIIVLSNPTLAFTTVERPQGFLWYNEVPKPQGEERVKLQRAVSPTVVKTIAPWDLRIKALKQEFETAQRKALDNPTMENVVKAQRLQKTIMDKSERFAAMWQLASLIDHSLIAPDENSNSLHLKIQEELSKADNTNLLKFLAKDYGLILQLEPNCRYCEVFAPIVKEFAAAYGFQLLGVAKESGAFHGVEAIADTGMLKRLNPEGTVPTLYLVSADGSKIHPVARGITAADKIIENIISVHKHYRGVNVK